MPNYESFLDDYIFQEINRDLPLSQTRLYRHLTGSIDIRPEIQNRFAIDRPTAESWIHSAHQETRLDR